VNNDWELHFEDLAIKYGLEEDALYQYDIRINGKELFGQQQTTDPKISLDSDVMNFVTENSKAVLLGEEKGNLIEIIIRTKRGQEDVSTTTIFELWCSEQLDQYKIVGISHPN